MVTPGSISNRSKPALTAGTSRLPATVNTGKRDRFRRPSKPVRVKQHQLVYAALGDRMREEVHALSMQTLTPEEWTRAGMDKLLIEGGAAARRRGAVSGAKNAACRSCAGAAVGDRDADERAAPDDVTRWKAAGADGVVPKTGTLR